MPMMGLAPLIMLLVAANINMVVPSQAQLLPGYQGEQGGQGQAAGAGAGRQGECGVRKGGNGIGRAGAAKGRKDGRGEGGG